MNPYVAIPIAAALLLAAAVIAALLISDRRARRRYAADLIRHQAGARDVIRAEMIRHHRIATRITQETPDA